MDYVTDPTSTQIERKTLHSYYFNGMNILYERMTDLTTPFRLSLCRPFRDLRPLRVIPCDIMISERWQIFVSLYKWTISFEKQNSFSTD